MKQFIQERSVAMLVMVSCVVCMITGVTVNFCPDKLSTGCKGLAGVINCILCIVVLAKFFGLV